MIDHSCKRFLAPDIEGDLTDLLLGLADDIGKILDCPAIPPYARLSGIASAVDERAPAPAPDDARWEGLQPRPGSVADILIGLVTEIRRLMVHTGLNSVDKLHEIAIVLYERLEKLDYAAEPALT